MAMEFGVLASGSSGNAAVVAWQGQGVLIDLGLSPRTLAQRLDQVGFDRRQLRAALLTHVHADHWSERTLNLLAQQSIQLYCHPAQALEMRKLSAAFVALEGRGLLKEYAVGEQIEPAPGLACWPLELAHDGGMTCGFRFEGSGTALAYLADLGHWTETLAEQLGQVDVLALEFNHDVELERHSDRDPVLIDRILGQAGHLSNEQASTLVQAVLVRSAGRLRHLIQLHLSRQCNRPALAQEAAQRMSRGQVQVHTARQDRPGPWLRVIGNNPSEPAEWIQACLPGW